jgi:2-dehydro-3-deoxyphosphogluconate aldolase/(4S)-4-hydroxy-2-oxoglutarate aldolase
MTKEQVCRRIKEVGIVPVVRAKSAALAISAADAVCAGGIPIVEVTMTVPGAVEAIAQLVKSMGTELLVGAGTVLDAEMARSCLDAGAEFLVTPGFDRKTVELANREETTILAGALTPTEVINAWKAGSDLVKIFPCGSVGGPKYIRALRGPFPQVPMVPTGGVNLQTAREFILAGAVALGIGGELVSAPALESGNMAEITEAARQYAAIVRQARDAMAAPAIAR